jgi:hypothetical protein
MKNREMTLVFANAGRMDGDVSRAELSLIRSWARMPGRGREEVRVRCKGERKFSGKQAWKYVFFIHAKSSAA